MKILFLGDIVGISGCSKIMNTLLDQRKLNKIDFVIVNAEMLMKQVWGLQRKSVKIYLNVVLMLLQLEIMFGIKKI